MAKITSPNPDLIAGSTISSSIQVTRSGNVILKPKTLTYQHKRRPFWVVDLYAVRSTMQVAEPDEP
jgi:hypothetical protein